MIPQGFYFDFYGKKGGFPKFPKFPKTGDRSNMQKLKLLQTVYTFNEKKEPVILPFGTEYEFSADWLEWVKENKINFMVYGCDRIYGIE